MSYRPNHRAFPVWIKRLAFDRANGYCEGCGKVLVTGDIHYDHRVPYAMGGASTYANCQVLCSACHARKSRTVDAPALAKAERVRDAHIGARQSYRTLPFGRASNLVKKISGEIVPRLSLAEKIVSMKRKRAVGGLLHDGAAAGSEQSAEPADGAPASITPAGAPQHLKLVKS